MGDGAAPPVICIPFVVASYFDDLKWCFSNVHFFVLFHHNGVIINTSCWNKCDGLFMNQIVVCDHMGPPLFGWGIEWGVNLKWLVTFLLFYAADFFHRIRLIDPLYLDQVQV